ncbi:hypothetical protein MKW98_028688 [Papaver atlanticum]|uniref:Antimicrobial peptide 1 n=1 Tax=Papaver atlanticum TaxID=357466 RepID=A0AAD4S333_9MAGN|nr:hypothetical protein MKW98_028688 [Papaver atlanticum]
MAAYNNNSSSNFVSTATRALVFVALVCDFANASSMTVWSGPGCNYRGQIIRNCGCSTINLNGGGCRGPAHTRLNGDARMCSSFGWRSIFIQC